MTITTEWGALATKASCNTVKTVRNIIDGIEEYSNDDLYTLGNLAQEVTDSRIEFIDSIDIAARRYESRLEDYFFYCDCGHKCCANSRLARLVESGN